MKVKGFAVFLAIALVLGLIFLKDRKQDKAAVHQENTMSPVLTNQLITEKPTAEEIEYFDKKFHQEVVAISQVDESPEKTEERLKNFSKDLKATEIQALYLSILDMKRPQDERFLAVTLLSWSQKPEVGLLLENIALSEIDPFLSTGRHAEFENVLRMKAVEGLADLPLSEVEHQRHLQNIVRKTANAQVSDRAQRSLWALAGAADKPEIQDEKALVELLEKSTKPN